MSGYHLSHQTQGTTTMYINSADVKHKHGTSGSHFTYEFKDAITTREGEGILVSLISASIPYSFYNIRQDVNDKIVVVVTQADQADYTSTIVLPPGNYTATSLKEQVVSFTTINANIPNIVITFGTRDLKYTFGLAGGTDATARSVAFQFRPFGNGTPNIEFGFERDVVLSNDSPTATSDRCVDINGSIHSVYVRTNLPTRSIYDSQSGGVSDVLGNIMVNTDPGQVITLVPTNLGHESLIHTSHVRAITVWLTDERNRMLDLNGLNFQIGIQFKFVSLTEAMRAQVNRPVLTNTREYKGQDPPKRQKQQKRRRALKKGKQKVQHAMDVTKKIEESRTR